MSALLIQIHPRAKISIPESCHRGHPSALAIRVYAAGGLFWTDNTSFTLIQIAGHSLLSADIKNGELEISGDIYSPDGDLVHIDRNNFETLAEVRPSAPIDIG